MRDQEIKIQCKIEHSNGYSGTLYTDGTMDIYYKGKPVYLAGSNKVCPDDFYRVLDNMPTYMREIKRQNDKEFEK